MVLASRSLPGGQHVEVRGDGTRRSRRSTWASIRGADRRGRASRRRGAVAPRALPPVAVQVVLGGARRGRRARATGETGAGRRARHAVIGSTSSSRARTSAVAPRGRGRVHVMLGDRAVDEGVTKAGVFTSKPLRVMDGYYAFAEKEGYAPGEVATPDRGARTVHGRPASCRGAGGAAPRGAARPGPPDEVPSREGEAVDLLIRVLAPDGRAVAGARVEIHWGPEGRDEIRARGVTRERDGVLRLRLPREGYWVLARAEVPGRGRAHGEAGVPPDWIPRFPSSCCSRRRAGSRTVPRRASARGCPVSDAPRAAADPGAGPGRTTVRGCPGGGALGAAGEVAGARTRAVAGTCRDRPVRPAARGLLGPRGRSRLPAARKADRAGSGGTGLEPGACPSGSTCTARGRAAAHARRRSPARRSPRHGSRPPSQKAQLTVRVMGLDLNAPISTVQPLGAARVTVRGNGGSLVRPEHERGRAVGRRARARELPDRGHRAGHGARRAGGCHLGGEERHEGADDQAAQPTLRSCLRPAGSSVGAGRRRPGQRRSTMRSGLEPGR